MFFLVKNIGGRELYTHIPHTYYKTYIDIVRGFYI